MAFPHVSTEQMIAVDRLVVEVYGLELIQMMENAGRNLADLSRRMLGGDVRSKKIAVLCGPGNNGGGGMVAARHLHNWGAQVRWVLAEAPQSLGEVPGRQRRILEAMEVEKASAGDLPGMDLVIDALLGYGLSGDPRSPIAEWIEQVNAAARPVLALDTPSGLDTTSGIPGSPCVRAAATLTLALPKMGLRTPQASAWVGDLYLADISVPPQLYARLGLAVPSLFHAEPIMMLSGDRSNV
jgi:NAD(P)H-hydrate epimerase